MSDDGPPLSAGTPHEAIELWEDEAGAWRWRYRQSVAGVDLPSNRGYESREAALAAARLAYPGVAIFLRDSRPARRAGGSAPVVAVGLVLIGAVMLFVMVVVGLAGLTGLAAAVRLAAKRARALRRR